MINAKKHRKTIEWERLEISPRKLEIPRIMEKAREFQKNIYFCFIDYGKPLTVWITTNCGKF